MAEGRVWLTGDREAAEACVAALFAGDLAGAGPGAGSARLLESLATEDGLNATLRNRMEAADAPAALRCGLRAMQLRLDLPAD